MGCLVSDRDPMVMARPSLSQKCAYIGSAHLKYSFDDCYVDMHLEYRNR